ncbi:MAG: hypothetical protein NUV91_05380 [Candidatus Omnitrophica bacterium]|nr:hypothetical protein [Candidatus Omnitrophota bacterium]
MGWLTDIFLLFFIFTAFQGLKLDPEDVLTNIEEASLKKIIGRSLLTLGGLIFLHFAMLGHLRLEQSNFISWGLWLIIIYEAGGITAMLLARDSYVKVMREVSWRIPFFYRIILLAELGFFIVTLWMCGFLGLAFVIRNLF